MVLRLFRSVSVLVMPRDYACSTHLVRPDSHPWYTLTPSLARNEEPRP